jgi:hypothetical protein
MWFYAILILTLFDLFLVNRSFNPTIPSEQIYPLPGAIEILEQDTEIYRISGTGLILDPNSSMIFGLADIRGYEPLVSKRYIDLISRLEGHFPIHHHSLFVKTSDPLFDALNVKYVLTDQQLNGKWLPIYNETNSIKIYRNPDVLPRAFVVYRTKVVTTATQSLAEITKDNFNFREVVVLEERPANWTEPLERPATSATVDIVSYHPTQINLTVDTPTDGLLVLSESYAPGWKAWLDGEETQIYVANHAFRAVVIPAGQHQVRFVYVPLTFQIGAGLSLLALAAIIFSFVILGIRQTGKRR